MGEDHSDDDARAKDTRGQHSHTSTVMVFLCHHFVLHPLCNADGISHHSRRDFGQCCAASHLRSGSLRCEHGIVYEDPSWATVPQCDPVICGWRIEDACQCFSP